jgi:hypothetical protein
MDPSAGMTLRLKGRHPVLNASPEINLQSDVL